MRQYYGKISIFKNDTSNYIVKYDGKEARADRVSCKKIIAAYKARADGSGWDKTFSIGDNFVSWGTFGKVWRHF